MNKIMRCITSDGSIMAAAIDSSDIVHIAQSIHKTSPVATAALGRLLTASSILLNSLQSTAASIALPSAGPSSLSIISTIKLSTFAIIFFPRGLFAPPPQILVL